MTMMMMPTKVDNEKEDDDNEDAIGAVQHCGGCCASGGNKVERLRPSTHTGREPKNDDDDVDDDEDPTYPHTQGENLTIYIQNQTSGKSWQSVFQNLISLTFRESWESSESEQRI